MVMADYTALDVDAAAVDQLSKYVLDYAPHSFVAAAVIPLPAGFSAAPRVEYRRRSRSTGTFDYVLLDARIGRRIGQHLELFVDGRNLLDESYQEIAGVAMPGATMSVSLVRGASWRSSHALTTNRRKVLAASGSAASPIPTPDRRSESRPPDVTASARRSC